MSASNWDVCFRCNKKAQEEHRERENEFAKSYGKVSAEEYERLRMEARRGPSEPQETLREDYELGICSDGKFYVIYSAHCEECGFKHDFRHEEIVERGGDDGES